MDTRRLHLLLRTLMALCVAGLLLSARALISGNREYAQGDAAYEQIRRQRNQQQADPAADMPPDEAAGVDFAALRQINPEVVAWLAAQGSALDYPVVQGADNDYYLTHLFTGEQNKLGCLFADYRGSSDFSDKNTVIYGHNMKDGSMFASLTNYREQGYYDSYPSMRLYTPKGGYTLELFAGVVADGADDFVRLGFNDDADFLAYIDALKAKSTFKSDVLVQGQDRIVTLFTCSYDFSNARYALFGKLTPKAEPTQSP